MKRITSILTVLYLIITSTACKKEHLPNNNTNTTIFYFKGLVNGTNYTLNAGENNYYMYSSYTQDSNGVYNFIGNLKLTNSSLNSIEIQINDYKVSALNSTVNPDSSIASGNYSYYSVGVTDTVYNVQFTSSYVNGTAQTYHWDFGDGTSSTLANPVHAYSHLGIYHTCLIVSDGICSNSFCNDINVVYSSSNQFNKKIDLVASASLDTVTFSATVSGISAYRYKWNFGDGPDTVRVWNYYMLGIRHWYSSAGTYPVTLTVSDSANSDSITTYINAATSTYANCVTNYKVDTIYRSITVGNSLRLSDVIINWTDASGVTYTTNNNAPQPSGSYFTILSEETYQNNINNQTTGKLHVKFSCTLYNGSNSIQISNAEAIIAVAYK